MTLTKFYTLIESRVLVSSESKVKVIIEKSGGHMPWGKWSACSVTCDQGIKKRERECSYLGKWHQECEEFPK